MGQRDVLCCAARLVARELKAGLQGGIVFNIKVFLAGSTVLLVLSNAYLYRQLSTARGLMERDPANEVEMQHRVAQLEEMRAGLEAELRSVRSTEISGRPLEAAPSGSLPPAPATQSESLTRGPEMTKDLRLEFTRRRYRSLLREMALTDAEVAAVLPVLVDQDLRAKESTKTPMQDPHRNQAELTEILGTEKAERFEAARKLLPARAEVNLLRRRLEDSGEPLSVEQQQSLLEIVARRRAEPVPQPVNGDDPRLAMRRRMDEQDARLRDEAAPVLTASQRQLLEEDASFQNAMRLRAAAALAPQAGSGSIAARGL